MDHNFELGFGPSECHEFEGVTVCIDQCDLGWDLMGDEPVDIVSQESRSYSAIWNLHLGGADIPDRETMLQIYREEWQEIVEDIAYDCEERSTGIVVWPYWHDHAVTFKSWRNAARGMLKRDTGYDLDDMRIVEIAPEYSKTRSNFYVMWSQSNYEKYAGGKGYEPSTEYYQSIMSGDVYYISVTDNDDIADPDSCGGFVGEYWCDYIQNEARDMLLSVIKEKREKLATIAAQEMQEARPDMEINQ